MEIWLITCDWCGRDTNAYFAGGDPYLPRILCRECAERAEREEEEAPDGS